MAPVASPTLTPATTAITSPSRTAAPPRGRSAFGFDEYCTTSVRIAARGLIGRYGVREQDLEDLQQDIIVNLLPRLEAFEPAKGAWTTHVNRSVKKATASVIRHRCAQRRVPPKQTGITAEEDSVIRNTNGDSGAITGRMVELSDEQIDQHSQTLQQQAEMRMDLAAAMQELTPLQQQVCESLKYRNIEDTCTELGLERWQVNQAIHRIRAIFARFDLDPATH